MPVLYADGRPFVLKVWTAGLHLASQTNDQVKEQIDWAAANGFNAVEVMAEWRLIETVHEAYDWSRIDDLMDYAAGRDVYVLLTIEPGIAPAWFADDLHPEAVFVTYDPNPEGHPDMYSGRLAAPGEISVPIFYHPGYWTEADAFFAAAINRYKAHPALFGYDLCVFFTGEYNYPGGLMYGIAGFADYSDYTRGLYGSEPPLPLVEFSQPGPDARAEWLTWAHFRVEKKRAALDHFGTLVKRLDSDHVLVGWLGNAPLWGSWDNGLAAEATGGDYPYLLTRSYLDVIRAAPQVTPSLFEVVDGALSELPYMLPPTIQAAQRHGKVFLLQTERALNSEAPDVTGKITAWAEAFHSLGVHFLWWEEPEGEQDCAGAWTPAEKDELVATLVLADLPRVKRLARVDFAFVDLEFEAGKYYADNTFSLLYATAQAQAFLDAGLPYDTLSAGAILANPAVLDEYKAVGFIIPAAYDLLAPAELKAIIADYEATGGVVWRGDPVNGYNYTASGYTDTNYLDTLRAFYDVHSLVRHQYNGYGLQIWGNKPYVFVLSRSADYSGTLEVSIAGWGLADGRVKLLEVNSGRAYMARVLSDTLRLEVTLSQGQPYLFVCGLLTCIEHGAMPKRAATS